MIKGSNLKSLFSTDTIDTYNRCIREKTEKVDDYLDLLELDRRFIPAYNNLAEIYIRQNRIPAALDILKRGFEILQNEANLAEAFGWHLPMAMRLNLAISVTKSSKDKQAISKILKGWPLQDNELDRHLLAQGQLLYGESLYFSGDYKQAALYLGQAIQYYPDNEHITALFADALYQNEDFVQSAAIYDRIIKEDNRFETRQRRGMALLRAGRFDEAEKTFTNLLDEFLENSGKRQEYEEFLNRINAKKSQSDSKYIDKQIRELESVSDENDDNQQKDLGVLYIMKGEYQKALNVLSRARQKLLTKFSKKNDG